MSDPSDVLFDPAAAHPVVGEVRAAIARRDWAATRAAIESAPADARCALVRLGGSEKDLEGFLRGVLGRDPDDPLAGAMLGTHLTDHGWSIRTTALAKDVSREQFRAFHEWLRRAEQVLIEAAARTPSEPAVWSARLTSARGLSLGQAETRRRYDRLRALDPHNYDGQRQFLQTLCPKWGGSLDALHAWAREEMLAAPPGGLQGGLVAEAHFEHLVQLDGAQRGAFLADQRVRAELHEAAHRSIWHPEFRRPIGWVRVASGFAMMFGLLKDERSAAAAFAVLGNLASEWPWSGTGQDPAVTIRQRRARAYAAAGGA